MKIIELTFTCDCGFKCHSVMIALIHKMLHYNHEIIETRKEII